MNFFNHSFLPLGEKSQIHFKCQKEDGTNFTLDELIFTLETTKKALREYYSVVYGIEDETLLEQLSPSIIAVRNGCIDFSTIINGAISNILSTLIVFFAKKICACLKNKKVSLVYGKQKSKNCEGSQELNSTGASFFVSYLYHLLVDKNQNNWRLIKEPSKRISTINSNRLYWEKWLKKIIIMNDKKLSKNQMNLMPDDIKRMARILLKII